MVHLNDSVMAGGDVIGDEMLFPDNLTNLTKQQAICIRGAKKLEKECTQIEMEFFQKVQELEAQFYPRFKDIIEKVSYIFSYISQFLYFILYFSANKFLMVLLLLLRMMLVMFQSFIILMKKHVDILLKISKMILQSRVFHIFGFMFSKIVLLHQ